MSNINTSTSFSTKTVGSSSSSTQTKKPMPILFWRGAIDPNQLMTNTKIYSVIKNLLKNQHSKGNNLEKLKGYDIYSIRTNKKGRLLFSNLQMEGKKYLLLLEYLPNHGYKNSKFLKNGVLERFRNNQKEMIQKTEQPWEEISGKQAATIACHKNNPHSGLIGFEPVDYYNSTFIKLNDTQGTVLNAKLPMMVSGPPGSGKSCVALTLLSHFLKNEENQNDKRILFVCLSEKLAETMQNYWDKQLYSERTGTSEVIFKSYEDVLKNENPKFNKLSRVTEQEIYDWLKVQKISNPKTVLTEFQTLSPYSKEEYLKLGAKQSLYEDQDDRNNVWSLFQKYTVWLKTNNKYDIRFADMKKKGGYDLIAVDEAADFSPLAMMQLYNLAKNGKISFFMDTQQDLEDGLSKRIHLKKLMFKNNIKIVSIHLPSVYRCPKAVVDLANRWLGIKAILSGGVADKDEYRNIQLANQKSKDNGQVSFTEKQFKEVYSNLRSKHKETDIAVITTEEKKEDLKNKGLNKTLLFTSEEIKGLEFSAVILYKPFDLDAFKEINKRLVEVKKDELKKNLHRSKQKPDISILSKLIPEMNKFFTSITRTKNTLVICQKRHHHLKHLYRLLSVSEAKKTVSGSSNSVSIKTTTEDWFMLAKEFLYSHRTAKFEEVCRNNLKKDPEEVKRQIHNTYTTSSSSSSSTSSSSTSTQNNRVSKKNSIKPSAKQRTNRRKNKGSTVKKQKTIPPKKNTPVRNGPSEREIKYIEGLSSNLSEINLRNLLMHKKRERFLIDVPCENGLNLIENIFSSPKKIELFFRVFSNSNQLKKIISRDKGLTTNVLVCASLLGNKNFIKLLIESGADINGQDERGETALTIAVKNGNTELVELLIEKGAEINGKNKDGETALTIAVRSWSPRALAIIIKRQPELNNKTTLTRFTSHIKNIELLIEKGADINSKNMDGETVLMNAIQNGNTELVELLIKNGAEINGKSKDGETALMYAAQNGNTELVARLIKNGAEINGKSKDGETALMFAIFENHTEIVELLIENGANINAQDKKGDTALLLAVQSGHEKVVELLIKNGAKINDQNKNGATALMCAAQNGHEKVVELLIKRGAVINAQDTNGVTPLMSAAQNGHEKVVERLIKCGAETNARDIRYETALMYAAQSGHEKVIKLLINSSADINAQDKNGATTLLFMAQEGRTKIVELLIKGRADINLQNNQLRTPLMYAAYQGRIEIVKLLIKSGANINLRSNSFRTALIYAAMEGHEEIIKLLIKSGANINLRSNSFRTALMYAAMEGHEEVIKLLIKSGADIEIQDEEGHTALYIAAKNSHKKVVDLLIKQIREHKKPR
jgi:ankyrin repeat protein